MKSNCPGVFPHSYNGINCSACRQEILSCNEWAWLLNTLKTMFLYLINIIIGVTIGLLVASFFIAAYGDPLQGGVQVIDLPAPAPEPTPILQGGVEQDRINNPLAGNVDESQANGYINTAAFAGTPPPAMTSESPGYGGYGRMPTRSIPGNTAGGQDEYWVDWQTWSNRIRDAMTLLVNNQYYGATGYIYYDIYRDGHIVITGSSGNANIIQRLTNDIMSLQYNPVLNFPPGTQLMKHPRVSGIPRTGWARGSITQYWGPEHVVKQW